MNAMPRFFLLLILISLCSCKEEYWDVEIDDIDYQANFVRLDTAVFALSGAELQSRYQGLLEIHPDFLTDYVEDIMRIGDARQPMTPGLLSQFIDDPLWRGLQNFVWENFPDLKAEEQEMERALKRYAAFFGEEQLPDLVAYNSGFNVGVYPTDYWIGVGLEWFAGKDNKWVKQLPPDIFPQYKRDKMERQYLVPNALRGWLMYRYRELAQDEDLLGEMIFAGKVLYLTRILLQLEDEQRVLNYSPSQMRWARENEYLVWKNLVERDLVYNQDPMEINKLMNDGPFTPGMPQESPGAIGKWLGYRMMEYYVKKNPNITLPELMRESDKKKILKAYKPGK